MRVERCSDAEKFRWVGWRKYGALRVRGRKCRGLIDGSDGCYVSKLVLGVDKPICRMCNVMHHGGLAIVGIFIIVDNFESLVLNLQINLSFFFESRIYFQIHKLLSPSYTQSEEYICMKRLIHLCQAIN